LPPRQARLYRRRRRSSSTATKTTQTTTRILRDFFDDDVDDDDDDYARAVAPARPTAPKTQEEEEATFVRSHRSVPSVLVFSSRSSLSLSSSSSSSSRYGGQRVQSKARFFFVSLSRLFSCGEIFVRYFRKTL